MFKIEKGMPIIGEKAIRGESKYPIRHMEIGDSFLIPTDEITASSGMAARVAPQAKRYGFRLTVRKQKDGSYRVWRIA